MMERLNKGRNPALMCLLAAGVLIAPSGAAADVDLPLPVEDPSGNPLLKPTDTCNVKITWLKVKVTALQVGDDGDHSEYHFEAGAGTDVGYPHRDPDNGHYSIADNYSPLPWVGPNNNELLFEGTMGTVGSPLKASYRFKSVEEDAGINDDDIAEGTGEWESPPNCTGTQDKSVDVNCPANSCEFGTRHEARLEWYATAGGQV